MFALTHLVNDLINSFLHVFTIGALRSCGYSWWLLYLCLLFFRFNTELFFNSFKAITSLRDELLFGLVTVISASCVLKLSQSLSRTIKGWTSGIQLELTWNGCSSLFYPWKMYLYSKSCKSFVTGVEMNLRLLIACWLDSQKFDSLRDSLGMFYAFPFLWLKAYILKCVYALCVLCFLFCFRCY